ncbi:hypothetical protein DENSPDRAFT_842434 [Dentipellis sp. KUC8613]|nr:hypothetical protein DENSPDRAFT_842434 [Dentipellis sp. KUC8613]
MKSSARTFLPTGSRDSLRARRTSIPRLALLSLAASSVLRIPTPRTLSRDQFFLQLGNSRATLALDTFPALRAATDLAEHTLQASPTPPPGPSSDFAFESSGPHGP